MITVISCSNLVPDSGMRAIESLWVRIKPWKTCQRYYDHHAEYSSPIEINGTLEKTTSSNIAQADRKCVYSSINEILSFSLIIIGQWYHYIGSTIFIFQLRKIFLTDGSLCIFVIWRKTNDLEKPQVLFNQPYRLEWLEMTKDSVSSHERNTTFK